MVKGVIAKVNDLKMSPKRQLKALKIITHHVCIKWHSLHSKSF